MYGHCGLNAGQDRELKKEIHETFIRKSFSNIRSIGFATKL